VERQSEVEDGYEEDDGDDVGASPAIDDDNENNDANAVDNHAFGAKE
jgi:hypothetical protein